MTVSVTVDQVIVMLSDFITAVTGIPSDQIVRGQDNMAALPVGNVAVLTEINQKNLSTTTVNQRDVDADYLARASIDIQCDFYGELAGDNCRALENTFRSTAIQNYFSDDVKPLYASDSIQSPLISGEQQYVARWTLTATLQYNSFVTLASETFNTAGDITSTIADYL